MKRRLLNALSLISVLLLVAGGLHKISNPPSSLAAVVMALTTKNTSPVLEGGGKGWLRGRARWPMSGKETEYLLNTNQIPMLLEK
jgi:hypothetical protein